MDVSDDVTQEDLDAIEERWKEAPPEEHPRYLVLQVRLARALKVAWKDIERRENIDDARKDGSYWTKGMLRMRKDAESLCSDSECLLSGGEQHAGDCEPCDCGLEHAALECPVGKIHAPPRRRSFDNAQCGYHAGTMQMTFRGPESRMSAAVNCEGCRAIERVELLAEMEKQQP